MDHDHAVKILDQTITVLTRDGWRQGELGNARVGRCLSGALARATCEMDLIGDIRHQELAERAVMTVTGDLQIPYWNDRVAESVEDVILTVKQARTDLEGASA